MVDSKGKKSPAPTKTPKEKLSTGQSYSFPIESFINPAPSRIVRTPLGYKTNTKFNSGNQSNDSSQARENKFKKS